MVKAFVDFDQENVQKKTAIRYYKNVPRYITRKFKRENALKTVATQNTPEKIKKLNTIIKKIDNLKQKKIKKKEKVSLKRKRNVRDEVENENVETMFNKDLNYGAPSHFLATVSLRGTNHRSNACNHKIKHMSDRLPLPR